MICQVLEPRQLLAADWPVVESVQVGENGGGGGRSAVSELSVRFDQTVNVSGANGSPVTLVNVNDGTVISTTHNESVVGGKTVMTLTFPSGPSVVSEDVIASSLADGSYQLRVHADSITAAANGNSLDGDGNGIGGDDYVLGGYDGDTLFRLYGDASGDGNVGLTDFAAFRSAFGSGPGDVNFDSGLDANRDGNIGLTDFASFRSNFGSSPSAPARPAVIAEVMRTGSPASEPSSDSEFIVTINSPNSTDTTINYTVGGTATPGVDYDTLSGTATIIAGQTSVAIPVELINDPALEADETITIELTSSSVALSPTGTVASLTIIDGGAENQSPAFFAGQTLSLPGIVSLGGYVGRVPAYDPDGDELTYAISGGSLPVGLLSVDPDTGDLYLADAELLPQAGISGTVGFTATDPDGLVTTGTVSVDLPPLPETVDDDFRDAGSHRSGITFDMRPTSVSADGETLYTSLLKDDGNPLLPGETLDDVEGGYLYGTFQAGQDGVLTYTPNETLYQDQFFGFSEDFFLTGVSRLQRPEQTLVLLAAAGSSGAATAAVPPASGTTYKRLAERKATPRLTNTQPVGIADGFFSFDQGILTTRPVFVSKDDLISIDVSQWFIDPDGDEILATTAFTSGGSDTVEIDTTSNPSKVLIDVVGDEIPFIFTTRFEQANVTIYIGDHPFSNTGPELSIPLQNFGDSFPVYDVPEGITYVDNTDRSDVGPTGIRDAGSDPWQQRFNDYSLTSTTYFSGNDTAQAIAVGSASVDLTTGNAKVAQPLPLADAFDDLSVPLGGLIYSGDLVDNKSLAKVIVEVPGDESRDIDRFDVTVELADHFAGNASSPLTRNYTFNIASDDQDQDQADQVRRFELTVPLINDSADVLDSGVFGYQVKVVPHFVSTSTDPADRPITLRSSGRVAVVKQTTVTPSDFGNSDSSYSQFAPEFSDGWQLAGLPRFILDRGNIQSGTFENDPGSIAENSIPQAIIQFPGSDKLSIFRGTPAATGQPYSFLGSTFTPVDLEFGTVDADEFGTLDLSTSNVFTYTDGSGTQYQFERFNMAATAGKSGDPTPQFLVTKITPPDGSGLVIDYLENDGSDATPSVNNTGTANDGPLRINSINALRSTADSGSLTFQYNTTGAVKRVDKIVFGDGREILLDYDGDLLETITQSTSAGEEDILHGFGYTTVGTGAGETDRPMVATITHAHLSPTDTLILDDKTELTYDDGGIVTATHGIAADNPTVTTLETFWSQKESIRAIAADVSELPSGSEILPGDNEALLRATSILTIRTAAGDLQAYDEQSSTAVSAAGDHVTRHHLDGRGNVIITDRVFDPAADPSSDDAVIRSRTKTRYDHFDNPVKLTDAVGRETTMLYDYTYPTASNVLGLTTHAGTVRHLPTLIKSPAGIQQIRRESTILAAMGAPIETIDVLGRRSTFTYDTAGRSLVSTDYRKVDGVDSNRVTTLTYDAQGRPDTATNPLGLIVDVIDYDTARPRLPKTVRTTQPAIPGVAAQRQWESVTVYDSRGYIDTITTTEGSLTVSIETHTYDDRGRLTTREIKEGGSGPTLRTSSHVYDSLDRPVSTTDGRGAINKTDYDTAGRVIQTIAADGATFTAASTGTSHSIAQRTNTIYYADGSVRQQTLPDGTTVDIYHDPAVGDPSLFTRSPSPALMRSAVYTWTVTSDVAAEDGSVTNMVVVGVADELGRPVTEVNLLNGQSIAMTYGDAWRNSPSTISRSANLGSLTATPSAAHVVEIEDRTATDRAGQVVRSQFADTAATIVTYDSLGYMASSSVLAPLGLKQKLQHDSIGNQTLLEQTVLTPISSTSQTRSTTQVFDASSYLRKSTDSLNRTTTIDIQRQGTSVDADGPGPATADGRVLLQHVIVTPDGAETMTATDAVGQTVVSETAFGAITTSTFNSAGDLTRSVVTDPRGGSVVAMPGSGSLTLAATPARRTDFAYDDLGRLRRTQYMGDPQNPASSDETFSTHQDFFLPVDNGGVDVAFVNAQGGETETTYDSIGQPIEILHPFLGLDSQSLLRPQRVETFDYDYDKDAQTTLVTHTVANDAGNPATDDQTRITRQVRAADGRVLIDADRVATSGSIFVDKAVNVYSQNLDIAQTRDASDRITSMDYDHVSQGRPSAGTGLLTESSDLRGRSLNLYNSVGERVVSYDFKDNVTNWTYDSIGRMASETTRVPVGTGAATPAVQPVTRTWIYSDPGIVTLNDRNGNDITTTVDYTAATVNIESVDYQNKSFLTGEGRTLAVADATASLAGANDFGVGQSRVEYAYDAIGRLIGETTVINQVGVDTPSTRVTMGYDGFAMDTRSVAIAASGSGTGFQTVAESTYRIDRSGRADSVGLDLQNASKWKAAALPQDFAIESLYQVDGQIDRLDRYIGDDSIASANLVIQSQYGYRGDGVVQSVHHQRPGIGGNSIAQHELIRTPDGRPDEASAEVFGRLGVSLDQADASYDYDQFLNAKGINGLSPGENGDLIPGFAPLDPNGEVDPAGGEISAGGRRLGDSDRYFRYDNEGRQVLDFIDGGLLFADDITAMAYDIGGRLRQVTRTLDGNLSDTITTVSHAYDAAGRRVATRVDDDGTISRQGFYGPSTLPELIFESPAVAGTTTATIRRHVTTMPGVTGPVAISGVDGSDQTVWALGDYGGATRSYVAVNPDGSLAAVRHQNFDGQGLPLSVIDDAPGRFGPGVPLPVSFAGNELDAATGLYAIGGTQWYDPELGRRLSSSSIGGNDNYSLETGYANARVEAIESSIQTSTFWGAFAASFDPNERALGVSQAAGGVAEFIVGVGGALPTLGGSLLLSARGIDDLITGVKTAVTGEFAESYTSQGVRSGASGLGFSNSTAGSLATGVDIASRIAGPAAAGIAGRTVGRLNPEVGQLASGSSQFLVRQTSRLGQAARRSLSRFNIAPKGASRIYTLTNNIDDIATSGRVWGQTEGAVYGLPSRQFWKGSINPKLDNAGVIIFRDQAATLFHPHRVIGPLSLFKRSLTQYKTGLGDVVIDMATASRRGNVLIVRNAEMGANLGRVKPFGLVDVGPSSFWGPARHYSRVAFEGTTDILIVGGIGYRIYDAANGEQ